MNSAKDTLASASKSFVQNGHSILENVNSAVNEIDWNEHLETIFATIKSQKGLLNGVTTDVANAMSGITWTEARERAANNLQQVEETLMTSANYSVVVFLR